MLCGICHKSFEPTHPNSKLCSIECKKESKKLTNLKYNNRCVKLKSNLDTIDKLENEEFRPIKDFENDYFISNCGRVYSRKGQRLLNPSINVGGYYCVRIGVRRLLHRLVAYAFIQNNNVDYTIIDHIDRCRTNNNVNNLRWCNYKMNTSNSSMVLFKKGGINNTTDKVIVNGKEYIYYGFRVNYGSHHKRFKKLKDAEDYLNSLITKDNCKPNMLDLI